MKLSIGRIIVAAMVAEILAIAALVILVAIFGPPDAEKAKIFAEQLGQWVGPIGGFVFCLLGGYWVAKGLEQSSMFNGLIFGIVAAGVDISLLVMGGASFQWLFVVSNVGRIIAGIIGAWFATTSIKTVSESADD